MYSKVVVGVNNPDYISGNVADLLKGSVPIEYISDSSLKSRNEQV